MASNSSTPSFDWIFLLDSIRNEKCLLVLGDNAFITDNGYTCQERLIEHIRPENHPSITRYYPSEGFFLFKNSPERMRFAVEVKRFYETIPHPPLLDLLAQIPFHLYLNISPDMFLLEAFEQFRFPYQFDYYAKNKLQKSIEISPSANYPLIYNLFGCIKDPSSTILTHDDLYEYFKSLFAKADMLQELRSELQEIRCILFIGVQLEKWYLQLLLRDLEFHHRDYGFTSYSIDRYLSNEAMVLYNDQFNIIFISDNIPNFINNLFVRCQEFNILRKKEDNQVPQLEMVRAVLATGDLERAIEMLMDNLSITPYRKDAEQIGGRFNLLRKEAVSGTMSQESILLEQNRISKSILDLISEVESKFKL